MAKNSARVILVFLFTIALFFSPLFAADDLNLPELKARVNDYTSSLSAEQITELENKLQAFEIEKGTQIVVAIVPTTGAYVIEEYAVKLQEKWKIGRAKIDDGILLVIAKDDHKLRFEVGYGLEGVVPDAIAKRIIEEIIVPNFKAGNFFEGINLGIDNLIGLVRGESLPETYANPQAGPEDNMIPVLIFMVVFVVMPFHLALKKIVGNFPSASLLSLGIGVIGATFLPFYVAVGAGLFIFVFLVLGLTGGSSYSSGSWGGSSGGGFSGGGGRSGGGGASGSW